MSGSGVTNMSRLLLVDHFSQCRTTVGHDRGHLISECVHDQPHVNIWLWPCSGRANTFIPLAPVPLAERPPLYSLRAFDIKYLISFMGLFSGYTCYQNTPLFNNTVTADSKEDAHILQRWVLFWRSYGGRNSVFWVKM